MFSCALMSVTLIVELLDIFPLSFCTLLLMVLVIIFLFKSFLTITNNFLNKNLSFEYSFIFLRSTLYYIKLLIFATTFPSQASIPTLASLHSDTLTDVETQLTDDLMSFTVAAPAAKVSQLTSSHPDRLKLQHH